MARSLLERLEDGEVILGDGSWSHTLERRGYCLAGYWTPESAAEHPHAVEQLGIEFSRCGADVIQTYTYQAPQLQGSDCFPPGSSVTNEEVNEAACAIAARVRAAKGCFVAGGLTTTGLYKPGRDCKREVQEVYKRNLATLVSGGVDFIILEFFRYLTELEWAVEVCLDSGLPVGAMLCMEPAGELGGTSVEQCAVRIAKAGASLVGVNCLFDPQVCLGMMERMKAALEDAGLISTTHLMAQPMGWRAPDASSWGHSALPEFPFSLEPRQITRWEARKWVREAYNLGVRYIGGCCGFEPYHIRAMAEELALERGRLPEASQKSDHDLKIHAGLEARGLARYRNKGNLEWWMKLEPSTGRPLSAVMAAQDKPALLCKGILD